MHAHAALRERERDPARPDPELERRAVSCQLGQEVDDRLDHGRIEHVRGGLVVALGDLPPKWFSGITPPLEMRLNAADGRS